MLIPRSSRRNVVVQQAIPRLATVFRIRDIDDSPSTPGDLVFPSLKVACVIASEDVNDTIIHAGKVLQRRRCLILAPQATSWEIQFRYNVL